MGHTGYEEGICEFLANCGLNLRISRKINATCCFIKNNDGAAPKKGTRERNKLPLAL